MSTYTKYKRIEKPLALERYNIDIVNKNNDIIDSELHKLELKNESQDNLLATKEALNTEVSRATTKENAIESSLSDEISRSQSAEFEITNNLENEVNRAITAETTIRKSLSDHILNEQNPHNVTKAQIGLGNVDNTSDMDKPVSTAQQNALDTALSTHNTSDSSHSDMRFLISGLTTRLNALADSDDTTLDQLSEIVAYIKNNKSLIDGITTSKVNVSDIIDDLTSSATGKPLSARQGMILKGLITDLTSLVGDKVDKVSGKGLSTNDYTTEEKTKLGGIAVGAEVNVQADWNETDSTSDAFIKNKPDINSITNNAIDDITPASIGAVAKAGDTMSGMLQIKTNGSGPNNPKLMTLDENGTHTYVGSDCVETVTPEGAVGILKLNPEGASGAGEVQVGSPLRIQKGMNVNLALDNHPDDDYQFFMVFNGYTDDGTGGNVGYQSAGQVHVGKASQLVDYSDGVPIRVRYSGATVGIENHSHWLPVWSNFHGNGTHDLDPLRSYQVLNMSNDWRAPDSLPSSYPVGVTIFFHYSTAWNGFQYGTVVTIKSWDYNCCTQFLLPYSGTRIIYLRTCHYDLGDTWGPWERLWTSADFDYSISNIGNNLVQRDSSGHIHMTYGFANYYNQSSGNDENPPISQFIVQNGSDGYNRKASVAHVKAALGIDELKNSVSNGKAQVASAITAKGVTTAADATFATMAANIGSISGGDKFWLGNCGRASGMNSGGTYITSSPPNSGYAYMKVIVIVTGTASYGDVAFWNSPYGATMTLENNYSGSVVNSSGSSYTWSDYSGKMANGMFSCVLRMIIAGNSSPWGFMVKYTKPANVGLNVTLSDLRYAYILQFSNSASW